MESALEFVSTNTKTMGMEWGRKSVRMLDSAAGFSSFPSFMSFGIIDLSGFFSYRIRKKTLDTINMFIDLISKNEPQSKQMINHRKQMIVDVFEKLTFLLRADRLMKSSFPYRDKLLLEGDKTIERLSDLLDTYEISTDKSIIDSVRESEARVKKGKTISADEFLASLNVHA